LRVYEFQSSPAPRRGRYTSKNDNFTGANSFNPRPRRGAGATPYVGPPLAPALVSILARAEARALRLTSDGTNYYILFQSSPAPRRGRYLIISSFIAFITAFQSSPAPRRGRYRDQHHLPP